MIAFALPGAGEAGGEVAAFGAQVLRDVLGVLLAGDGGEEVDVLPRIDLDGALCVAPSGIATFITLPYTDCLVDDDQVLLRLHSGTAPDTR